MLFDPLEEQFDLPSLFVEGANRDGRQSKVVGEKHESLVGLCIDERDASEYFGVPSSRQYPSQPDTMIADQSNAVVDGKGLDQFGLHVGFGPRHKESPVGVQIVESSKVDVGFVHDVKRASLDVALLAEQVENFDVVHLAVADVNKTWNRTLQIYQRVKLDGRLGCSKWRPLKQTQTQVYRRRIQRINGGAHQRVQFGVGRFVGVKRTCRTYQVMGQIGKDFPGSDAVCIGQRVARDRLAAQPHMIEMFALRSQIDLDIAQRFARSELCKGKNQELIQTTEILNLVLRSTSCNHSTECFERQISHDLREYQLSIVHDHPRQITSANDDSS
jgi:Txe/YoeB family toxin of Txe-Axe toxin-antitoxin module